MKKLLVCLGVCSSLFFSTVSLAEDKCKDDPRACFDGFENDGTVKPKDSKVKRTFSFPPIKAGFVVDIYNRDVLPHISLELKELHLPYIGDLSFDVGIATSRVFGILTWEFIPIIKAGPNLWVGYNVKESSPAFGLGFSILDF